MTSWARKARPNGIFIPLPRALNDPRIARLSDYVDNFRDLQAETARFIGNHKGWW
jgi:hypothetical protein